MGRVGSALLSSKINLNEVNNRTNSRTQLPKERASGMV